MSKELKKILKDKLNKIDMKRKIQIVIMLTLILTLLNCVSNRYVQETYSKGGYPSHHPTHKK